MSTIIGGSSPSVTFPDSTVQDTSAIVGGKVPYANLPAGSVLQVVQATTTSTVTLSGTAYMSTGLSASITPKFSTSKILVTVTGGNWDTNAASYQAIGSIYRNNTTNLGGGSNSSLTDTYTQSARSIFPVILQILDSPATTSSTTYTLYFYSGGGTNVVKYNTQNGMGVINLMEIAG